MSEATDDAGALFRAGKLQEAVAAANAGVRKAPAAIGERMLLAELLLFAGNIERADVILDAASQIDPGTAVVVAEFRQLLRAEMARRQLHRDGRLPEFLDEPTPALAAQLAGFVALRAGDRAAAAAEAARAEALRPRIRGTAEGYPPFADFRDADDLCAGYFEVLTSTGRFYWLPTERVESIEFHPPKRPRDLYWRRASMSVRQGPDGDVYIPALYFTADTELPDALRLGRSTDWPDSGDGPVCGRGQRVFLAGDEPLTAMQLGTIRFAAAG